MLAGDDVGAAGNDLVAGVEQFTLGLVALLAVLGVALIVLGNAVIQLRLSVAHERLEALARLRFAGEGHAVLVLFDAGLVLVGVDLALGIKADVDVGVIIAIKALVGDVGKGHHRAGAEGGAAALVVEVGGRIAKADDGVFAGGEHVQGIFVVGVGKDDLLADAVHGEELRIDHGLVFGAGQAAGGEAYLIDVLGEGVEDDHAGHVQTAHVHQRVLTDGAGGGGDAGDAGKGVGVALIEAHGGDEAVIVHALAAKIVVAGLHHGVAADAQAAEKAHAKGDDRQDRQIPPQALAYLAQGTFSQRSHITTRSPQRGRRCR